MDVNVMKCKCGKYPRVCNGNCDYYKEKPISMKNNCATCDYYQTLGVPNQCRWHQEPDGKIGSTLRIRLPKDYRISGSCVQCFGSCNDPNKCLQEYCELRLRETGDLRKHEQKEYECCRCSIKQFCGYSHCPNRGKKEITMTRQEAIEKLQVVNPVNNTKEIMVDSLAALGLIKFEEEKKKEPLQIIADCITTANDAYRTVIPECALAAEICAALKKAGWYFQQK